MANPSRLTVAGSGIKLSVIATPVDAPAEFVAVAFHE